MKLADLSNDYVLACFGENPEPYQYKPVYDELVAAGVPWKIVIRRIDRMVSEGLLDYGVSARLPWLTPKGVEAAKAVLPTFACP